MAGSLQLSNGELWQCCDNHMLLSKDEKMTREWVKWGPQESSTSGPARSTPAQHLCGSPGTRTSKTPPVSHKGSTAAAGQGGTASLARGCHCLAPGNGNKNHRARTVLESHSSISCKVGDKADCVAVQSFLFLKESQIQKRVLSVFKYILALRLIYIYQSHPSSIVKTCMTYQKIQ